MSSDIGGGQPIPTSTTGKAQSNIPKHWWFDKGQTGVFNSSPPQNTVYPNSPTDGSGQFFSSSPSNYSSTFSASPHDPKVAIPLPAADDWNKWRRDSLKNMYHLNDFATD